MRVSPVAWWFDDLDRVLVEAKRSAVVTHDHPQGIAGAQAIAGATFLARTGSTRRHIRAFVTKRGFRLDHDVLQLRRTHVLDVTCTGTVPVAVTAFLEAYDFESCIRKAVSIGGDSDTLAAMAGSIAEAYFGVPSVFVTRGRDYLTPDMLHVIDRFTETRRGRIESAGS